MKMQVKNDLTFREGCEEYLHDCLARNLRDGTIKHYRDSIKQLCRYVDEDMLIEDMDKSTMQDLIIQLRANPDMNDMTLYTYSRDMKTLMYFFMRKEWLERFVITLAKADKQPIECYTDEELRTLLAKPKLKDTTFTEYKAWTMVNFLLSTGVRQHSLVNIKVKDIDLEGGYAYINVTKNRKPLTIPLNVDMIMILKEYLKYRGGNADDYLFCNVYGKQLTKSTVYHTLYDFNKARGVDTTGMHRFRHTFAKKFIMAGGSPVTLQKILGHSSLAITENYLNILVCDLKKDIDEFNVLAQFRHNRIKMK